MDDGAVALSVAASILIPLAIIIFLLCRSDPRNRKASVPVKADGSDTRWWQWMLLAFFVALWFAITFYLDYVVIRMATQQNKARSYDSAEGKITKCSMIKNEDDEGTTYDVEIEYAFRIGDQNHRVSRVRYYKLWGRSWVVEFVAKHPPETAVTVYYDPANPADAILLPEMDGALLWMAMFLVPFNLVCMLPVPITAMVWRRRDADLTAVRSFERNSRVHVSFGTTSPALAWIIVFAPSCFLYAAGFAPCCGMPPSFMAMGIAWTVVILLSCAASVRVWHLRRIGYFDLILDYKSQTLTVPTASNGRDAIVIPFREIASIAVIEVPEPEDQITIRLVVNWQKGGEIAREIKINDMNKEAAERLATWMRERIG